MKLRFAIKMRIRPDMDRMEEYKLLTEEEIKKLNLDNYEEDSKYDKLVYQEMLDAPCIKIHESFHFYGTDEEGLFCDRIGGFEIDSDSVNCENCSIISIISLLSDFDFENMNEIIDYLLDKYDIFEGDDTQ